MYASCTGKLIYYLNFQFNFNYKIKTKSLEKQKEIQMLVENNQNLMAAQEQVSSVGSTIKLNATHNILSMRMQELRFDNKTQIS